METQKPNLIPLAKWSEYHPYPSVAGLRWLVFHEKTNGFHQCVKRVGRRVLIDEAAYFEWVEAQQEPQAANA